MKFKTGDILVDEKRASLPGTSRAIFVFISYGKSMYNVVRIGALVPPGPYREDAWISMNNQLENIRYVLISYDRGAKKATAEEMKMIHDEIKKAVRLKKHITMALL